MLVSFFFGMMRRPFLPGIVFEVELNLIIFTARCVKRSAFFSYSFF